MTIKTTSKLRVTHASSDALVAINLNGDTVDGLEMVDYQVASGLLTIDSGTYEVAVEALLTGEDTLEVINENLEFAPDMQYDVFALNQTANIMPVVLSREDVAPEGTDVRLDVCMPILMSHQLISILLPTQKLLTPTRQCPDWASPSTVTFCL